MEFAVQVCSLQHELGGGFVFEHPQSASSWRKIPKLRKLWGAEGVFEVIAHMCQFGMKATDALGEGPVLKPTRFLTNSLARLKLLSPIEPDSSRINTTSVSIRQALGTVIILI